MIRPVDIELWLVDLPLRRPFVSAKTKASSRRSVIVRMANTRAEGWGEAAPHPVQTRDTVDEAWELISAESARILGGGDPVPIEGSAATSAVDQALTALAAADEEIALARYVGGAMVGVPASAAIGLSANLADVVGAVATAVDAGYRHVKLKIAPGASAAVETVRKRYPDLGVAVDGNASFGRADWDELLRLDDLELDYIEQPLSTANLSGHADLQQTITTPICLDESIRRLGDIVTVATAGAAQAVTLKPGRLGPTLTNHGFTLATRHGLRVKIGGLAETGVGKHHVCSLATHDSVSLPSDLAGSAHWFEQDLVDPPWELQDGELHPRKTLAVDRDALTATTVQHQRLGH